MVLKKLTLVGMSHEKPLFDQRPQYRIKREKSTATPTRLIHERAIGGAPSPLRRQIPETNPSATNDTHTSVESNALYASMHLPEDEVIETIEADLDVEPSEDVDGGEAIVLDAKNSARQYYLDPITSLKREIWRPGDGDGDKFADYHDKAIPPKAVGQRWRFYQSRTGTEPIKYTVNEPPRFVVLDDRATYEVLASDIPRSKLTEWWNHDFAMNGKIRNRRPHRGRGVIGDPDAQGDDKYSFALLGKKNERYYFTGEKDYTPIIYRSPQTAKLKAPVKRKATSPVEDDTEPKRRWHNQYTPKELLVKNQPKATVKPSGQYGALFEVHDPLRDSPHDRKMGHLIEGMFTAVKPSDLITENQSAASPGEGEDLWMEIDDRRVRMKHNREAQYEPVDPAAQLDYSSEMDEIPFPRIKATASATENKNNVTEIDEKGMLEQDLHMDDDTEGQGIVDSGSYAFQLEQKLARVQKLYEEQKKELMSYREAKTGANGTSRD